MSEDPFEDERGGRKVSSGEEEPLDGGKDVGRSCWGRGEGREKTEGCDGVLNESEGEERGGQLSLNRRAKKNVNFD